MHTARPPRPSALRRPFLAVALLALVGFLAACGSDGNDTTTTTASAGISHTEATPAELEVWQQDLDNVGCWAGPVDGELGPQTEAAIKAFQAAKGLTVDGLLGPVTESALSEAAAAGETGCSTPATSAATTSTTVAPTTSTTVAPTTSTTAATP